MEVNILKTLNFSIMTPYYCFILLLVSSVLLTDSIGLHFINFTVLLEISLFFSWSCSFSENSKTVSDEMMLTAYIEEKKSFEWIVLIKIKSVYILMTTYSGVLEILYLLIFGKGWKSILKAEDISAFFGRLTSSPPSSSNWKIIRIGWIRSW